MKKLLSTVAGAAIALTGFAHAASIDFATYAEVEGERGLYQGEIVEIDGVNLLFGAVQGLPFTIGNAYAYLDSYSGGKPGGLGVCSTGLTQSLQCNVASDDNVTDGEAVGFVFLDAPFDISGFTFRGANHGIVDDEAKLVIGTLLEDGTADYRVDTVGAFIAMAAAGDAFFSNVRGIGFANFGTQFYVSALDASPVPVPAAGLLFASGIAGLGYARRKKAAA